LSDTYLPGGRGEAEEYVGVKQHIELRRLALAGDFPLAATDRHRPLKLPKQRLVGEREVDRDALNDAKLPRADARASDIGALAPKRSSAKRELNCSLLFFNRG
jgi:hypothetical protein